MKQADLVKLISRDTGIRYDIVRKVLRKMTRYFCVAVEQGEPFRIGMGTFHLKKNRPKEVQDFKTGQRYIAPASYKLKYFPSTYVTKMVRKRNVQNPIENDTK